MASFNLTLVSQCALADANTLSAFEDLHIEMLTWHAADTFPAVADVLDALKAGYAQNPRVVASADTLKQYASGIVKWAKAGQTPKALTMRAFMQPVPGAKSTKGRKPGQGAGKSTAVKPDTAQAQPAAVENTDTAWRMFIEDMRAKVAGRKDWPADRIVAFQDCAAKMIALIKSV